MDRIRISVEDYGFMQVYPVLLFPIVAAKEPSPEVIAGCEARYREIFRQHGKEHEIQFPKHYPTRALIGSVDVVDVVPYEMLYSLPIPETVGFIHFVFCKCEYSVCEHLYSLLDHSRRGRSFLCFSMPKLSCIYNSLSICKTSHSLETCSSILTKW